jgi:hypothetical protein
MASSISDAEREKMFGRLNYRHVGGGQVRLLYNWEESNIVTVYIPALDGVHTDGGKFSGRVRWHRRCVEQLQFAWAEAKDAGLMPFVKTWDGSFNPRLMRGSSTRLSNHAYGTAFDINAEWNGLGQEPAAVGRTGDVHAIAKVFKHHGFHWGGDWERPDGMHFEVGAIIDYEEEPKTKVVVSDQWRDAIVAVVRDGVSYASGAALAKLVGVEWEGADREVAAAAFLRSNGYAVRWDPEQDKVYAWKA